MHIILLMSLIGAASLFASSLSAQDPAFAKQVEASNKVLQDMNAQGSQPGETEGQKIIDTLAPVLSQLNLYQVSIWASLAAFGLLGFVVARWLEGTDWLGVLPLFALISGTSPSTICIIDLASQGVSSAALTPLQHGSLLALQLVSIYSCGEFSLWLKRRGTPPDNSSQIQSK